MMLTRYLWEPTPRSLRLCRTQACLTLPSWDERSRARSWAVLPGSFLPQQLLTPTISETCGLRAAEIKLAEGKAFAFPGAMGAEMKGQLYRTPSLAAYKWPQALLKHTPPSRSQPGAVTPFLRGHPPLPSLCSLLIQGVRGQAAFPTDTTGTLSVPASHHLIQDLKMLRQPSTSTTRCSSALFDLLCFSRARLQQQGTARGDAERGAQRRGQRQHGRARSDTLCKG